MKSILDQGATTPRSNEPACVPFRHSWDGDVHHEVVSDWPDAKGFPEEAPWREEKSKMRKMMRAPDPRLRISLGECLLLSPKLDINSRGIIV